MQAMQAWLVRYLDCRKEIQRDCAAIRRWQREAEGGTQRLDFTGGRTRGGARESRVEKAVCEMLSLREYLPEKVQRMVHLRREIAGALDTLPEARLRLILQYRYFHGLTFARIGEKMGYCEYYVSVLHKAALKTLEQGESRAG